MTLRWEGFGGSFFFVIQNPPYPGNSKIVLKEDFAGLT